MIRFNNDYNKGTHPAVLEALIKTNTEAYEGYGMDEWCEKGAGVIRKRLGNVDADIHFMNGGTLVNSTVIAAALRPFEGVIAPESSHINTHETGAVESRGHKIIAMPSDDGKLSVDDIILEAEKYKQSTIKEHIVKPKLVFISFPTEYGTTYTLDELREMRAVCDKYGLYLYVDGARLAYGLACGKTDVSLKDLAELADIFYIGGTKCGLLFGEAVVIINDELKPNFRSYIKQNGGMMAKGWLIGLQFFTLFSENLYLELGEIGVKASMKLRSAFEAKHIPFYVDSYTNQLFVLLTSEQAGRLKKKFIFEEIEMVEEEHFLVRFCTSWATTDEEVDELIAEIAKLK